MKIHVNGFVNFIINRSGSVKTWKSYRSVKNQFLPFKFSHDDAKGLQSWIQHDHALHNAATRPQLAIIVYLTSRFIFLSSEPELDVRRKCVYCSFTTLFRSLVTDTYESALVLTCLLQVNTMVSVSMIKYLMTVCDCVMSAVSVQQINDTITYTNRLRIWWN